MQLLHLKSLRLPHPLLLRGPPIRWARGKPVGFMRKVIPRAWLGRVSILGKTRVLLDRILGEGSSLKARLLLGGVDGTQPIGGQRTRTQATNLPHMVPPQAVQCGEHQMRSKDGGPTLSGVGNRVRSILIGGK